MKFIFKIIFLFVTPILLLAENKPKEIVKNVIDKQEQIVTLIENYFMSGNNVDLLKTTNKYFLDRETLSKYYNLNPSFFNNLSNEECVKDSTNKFCSNLGGLEFELVEIDNYYTGIRFNDTKVFGSNCTYCSNIFFKNFYRNIITGSRIKINENINDGIASNDSVFYPLKRNISDLFIKTDIYYDMYGSNLHIGEVAPNNKSKVWVDIRGVKAVERYWFTNSNKWLEKTSSNNITYLTSKKELLNVPKFDGTKVVILSENGFSSTYSYNLEYETKCQTSNPNNLTTYDQFCGWIKVIKGMDDFDFVINGIDLTNKSN